MKQIGGHLSVKQIVFSHWLPKQEPTTVKISCSWRGLWYMNDIALYLRTYFYLAYYVYNMCVSEKRKIKREREKRMSELDDVCFQSWLSTRSGNVKTAVWLVLGGRAQEWCHKSAWILCLRSTRTYSYESWYNVPSPGISGRRPKHSSQKSICISCCVGASMTEPLCVCLASRVWKDIFHGVGCYTGIFNLI